MTYPEHYQVMDSLLRKGMDVPEASLKAFQQITGKTKRRRMLRRMLRSRKKK